MHKIKYYEKYKQNSLQLKLILVQMGIFKDLKRKKIVFNPQPFSNQKKLQEKKANMGNQVDFHLELTKKIDEAITKNKEDEQKIDNKTITPSFIEIREPFARSPEISSFQTDISPNDDLGELDNIQEFVEIESPTNFLIEKQPENKDEFESWMINNENEKGQKTFWGLGPIKIMIKSKDPKEENSDKNNETKKENDEISIAQVELEETKKEIERKKKELEEAIKKEKQKQLELKKEEEEKRKQEKLKKLKLKMKQREDKILEKLAKAAEKEKQIELKKLEILKKIETEKKDVKKGKLLSDDINLLEETDEIERKKKELEEAIEKKKKEQEEAIKKEKLKEIESEEEGTQENLILDEDVAKLIPIIDSLFEKLPEEVIDEFTKSEYFELYEKVLLKYRNK